MADPTAGYSITHAPLIVDQNVIVGVSGGEYGIRGHVTAYNMKTGEADLALVLDSRPEG